MLPQPAAQGDRPCRRLLGLAAMLCAALWLASGTVARANEPSEIARTWDEARVALPTQFTGDRVVLGRWREAAVQDVLTRRSPDVRVPAVIFLHGCSGFSLEAENIRLILMDAGYAVFMPDSFARTKRRSNCNTRDRSTAAFPQAQQQRVEEIEFALDRVGELDWIDHRRTYLVGFSEGGAAVARSGVAGVSGAVILGWHCQGPDPFNGVSLDGETPVLAIIGSDDPWYDHEPGRHCGKYLAGRKGSRSLVLRQDVHEIFSSPVVENAELAQRALLEFLRAQ
ncbi:MAG: dienelactone hydrolase family protein [Alphaproteobacteria bacterium]|nr:dienelactone hydrolase family protein [Alphaproteobacteria bacterium]